MSHTIEDEFEKEFDPGLPRHDITDVVPVKKSKNSDQIVSVLEDIKAEIKEWYWQADKQALAKDPCVVDAMIDLFIRTIDAHIEKGDKE